MKKEWKKIFKRIGVLALAVTLLFETVVGNTLTVNAAADGNHVYVETYLDGVLEKTQDLGVKTGWVDIQLPYRAHYSMSEIWVNDVKQSGTGYCGFSMPANDVTVKLCYIADKHTISFFDLNGNSATEAPVNVNYNQCLQSSQVPDTLKDTGILITGWKLTGGAYSEFGWEVGKVYTKEQILGMKVGSDMTFQAVGGVSIDTEFKVTFKDEDKTTTLAEVETTGRTAAYPGAEPAKAPVEKDGYRYTYEFAGWVDENGKAASLTNLLADKTVYASYTEKKEVIQVAWEYTVIANAGDGKFADGAKEKTYAEIAVGTIPSLETPKIAATVNDGVKTEYKFTGWNFTDADGKNVDINSAKAGDVIYAKAGFEKKDTVLYYTVEVDENNGSAKEEIQVQVSKTPELTAPSKATTIQDGVKTEYEFSGWKYTVDGEEVTDLTGVPEGTKVVAKAEYTEKETVLYYNVVVMNDGAKVGEQKVQVSKDPVLTNPTKESVTDNVNGTRTEYTFAGWKFEDEAGNAAVPSETAEGQTIYAIATYTSVTTDIHYNVVVKDKDGETVKEEQVQVGKEPDLEAPDNYQETEDGETKEYIFKEWEYTDEEGNPVDPDKVPEGGTVIAIPKYDEKTLVYTVKYDAAEGAFADGSKLMNKEVSVGNAPAAVEEPKRETTTDLNGVQTEYKFIGWTYTDSTGKVITDFTAVPADTEITAKAVYESTEQSYKVIVQYKNGETDDEYTVAVGKDFVPYITPEKADETDAATGFVTTYEFAGWEYEKADGSVIAPKEAQAGDVVYAKAVYTATEQKYTVTYQANGGAFGDGTASKAVDTAVGNAPAAVENPAKPDSFDRFEGFATKYTFDKWVYTNEAGEEVTDLTKVKAGENITATAVYTEEEQSYKLYVDAQNGDPVQGPNKAKVGNEITLGIPEKAATEENGVRTEYTFKEWKYTDTEGTEYEKLSQVPAGKTVTATAVYDETKIDLVYNVVVDNNNGDEPTEVEVPVGTTPELPKPSKPSEEKDGERIDYEFKEWEYTDKDGNPVNPEEVPEGEEIYAKAVYDETKTDLHYTVKVDEANGKDVYMETVKVGTAPKLGTPVKEADEEGSVRTIYTFDKWVYTDKDGNEISDLTKVQKDEVVTATAVYTTTTEDITYNVVVDNNNGDEPTEVEVPVGTTPELPKPSKPSEEKDGERIDYEFKEWEYTDKDGNPVNPEEVPEGEEIYAKAVYDETKTDLHYTVKVDEANGKDVYTETVKVGTAPKLGTPVKEATVEGNKKTTYEFDKWVYTDKDGNEVDPETAEKDTEITATATYTEKTETISTPEKPQPPIPTPTPNPTPNPNPNPTPTPTPEPEPREVNEPELVPPVITPIPPTVVEEDDEEEPVIIEDEKPALDDGNGDDAKEVVAIDDEEVALAAESEDDNCFIHWIILILSAAYVIFAGVRIAGRKKKIDELEDEQNKQEAQA